MAYPITGELGKVNSVTDGTDLDQVLEVAVKTREITYSIDADQEDITGDGDTAIKMLQGLYGWGFDFQGVYPKTSPRYGNTALITFASGYVQYAESWFLDFDFGEEEITTFAASGPVSKAFRPSGLPKITGGYVARAANATALSLPPAVNDVGAAVTLKLSEDGAADPSFTGSIIPKQLGTTFGQRGLVLANYSFDFTGACTAVAGSTLPALLPAGAVDAADWGDGTTGPSTVSIVTQSVTSRTYTGYGYLRRLRVECKVNGVISVTGAVKGFGALTLA